MMTQYHRALTIAGSDSGGGAGVQADLKTFAALGCYGLSVITALTAQNTREVRGVSPVPPEFVALQLQAVLDDIGVDAVKTGMLHNAEVIAAVADVLRRYGVQRLVVDPVMVAKSGDRLLQDEAVEAVRRELIPLAAVLTPNLPEAEVLLQRTISNEQEMAAAAEELAALGARAVILKGGHFEGEICRDDLYLAAEKRHVLLDAPRCATRNTHGTGCTFSAAIAAGLAHGLPIEAAAARAKRYLTKAIEQGADFALGAGHGPVLHACDFRE